jgi:hypothetical protein
MPTLYEWEGRDLTLTRRLVGIRSLPLLRNKVRSLSLTLLHFVIYICLGL